MLNSLSYLLSKQGWANKCVWWFIMDKWTRDQWLGGCWNDNIMRSYILTLQTHMIILMSTLSETRFFVFILIFRKNACKEKMSECQTKAGNQECLNVWMFWTTFVFMCKLKSDCLSCNYHMSHFTYDMSHVTCHMSIAYADHWDMLNNLFLH